MERRVSVPVRCRGWPEVRQAGPSPPFLHRLSASSLIGGGDHGTIVWRSVCRQAPVLFFRPRRGFPLPPPRAPGGVTFPASPAVTSHQHIHWKWSPDTAQKVHWTSADRGTLYCDTAKQKPLPFLRENEPGESGVSPGAGKSHPRSPRERKKKKKAKGARGERPRPYCPLPPRPTFCSQSNQFAARPGQHPNREREEKILLFVERPHNGMIQFGEYGFCFHRLLVHPEEAISPPHRWLLCRRCCDAHICRRGWAMTSLQSASAA